MLLLVSTRLTCVQIVFSRQYTLKCSVICRQTKSPGLSVDAFANCIATEPPCQVRAKREASWLSSLAYSQLTKQQRLLNIAAPVPGLPALGSLCTLARQTSPGQENNVKTISPH